MSDALTAALALLLSTNRPATASNLVASSTGLRVPASAAAPGSSINTNDPVAMELQSIMAADDAVQEEIEKMATGADVPGDPALSPQAITLGARIRERAAPVRRRYERFISEHPKNAKARMAFGSFLNDLGEEEEAVDQWEKARELDPKDPAAWNNLANVYAHIGPVTKSFPYYEEALRLNPNEPVYLHNFGTLVFMFRRDATNYFKCDEQAVFGRAFDLYKRAIELDPQNFQLAADVAQTYYGWRLPEEGTPEERRVRETGLQDTALRAWTNALTLAGTDEEREGVHLHFARWNIRAGRYAEARTNLSTVTNEMHLVVKNRLMKSIADHESGARTNSPGYGGPPIPATPANP